MNLFLQKRVWTLGLKSLCLASAAITASAAVAQISLRQNEDAGLEEILVTARKARENLQDVPLTVNVLSAAAMENAGVQNLADMNGLLPNVVWESFGSTVANRITIRGIASNESTGGFDPGVGIYVDEVYLSNGLSFNSALLDVERVEVLKGPQGTLFGRNTTAGAISITTRRPSFDTYVEGDATIGNYDLRQARAVVNTSLSDKAALKISAIYRERDGYTLNVVDNSRNANDELHYGGRAQLLLTPTQGLDLLASVDWYKDKGAQQIVSCYGPSPFGNFCTHPTLESVKDRRVEANGPNDTERTMWGGSLNANLDLGGGNTLTSITAYRHLDASNDQDQDWTSGDFIRAGFAIPKQRQFSEEVRLATSPERQLHGVVGLYYSHEYKNTVFPLTYLPPVLLVLAGRPLPPQGATTESTQKTDSYAAFAQGAFDITSSLTLELGLRYTRDRKRFAFQQDVDVPIRGLPTVPIVVPYSTDSHSWGATSGTASLSWRASEGALLYARYARGYKNGGYNATAASPGQINTRPYNPEYLDSYEAGVKYESPNRRVRANLSAFYQKYKDIQILVQAVTRERFVANAGRAESQGAEAELSVLPVAGLVLQANAGIQYAEYTGFSPLGPANLLGKELTYAPRVNGALTATYVFPVAGDLEGLTTAAVKYRSDMWLDINNTIESPEAAEVNARIGLQKNDGQWGIYLYANNLTDVTRLISHSQGKQLSVGYASVNAPRTFGVELRGRF